MDHLTKIFLVFILWIAPILESSGQDENTRHPTNLKRYDTMHIVQLDGTPLDITGLGNMHLSYTETTDGYTIIRNNKGIFEYAEQTFDGDLKPSGRVAHNPGYRTDKEKRYLKRVSKHLRYESPTLDKLMNKKKRLFPIEMKRKGEKLK